MNNNILDTGITEAPPQVETKKPTFLSKITDKLPMDKIPDPVKQAFSKFYANKKIFWPITIVFGLMFLIIILGLLFGNTSTPVQVIVKKTPIPFVQATPTPCDPADTLCETGNKLKDLNTQINSLDLNQNRLAPPPINYNISF